MMTEKEFWDILAAMPVSKPVFYRLYYRSDGSPVVYTMEDLPGEYIEVDQETYAADNYSVRVVDGKIKRISRQSAQKLIPGQHGTPCHPNNVAIVDPDSTKRWSKQIYGFEKD